MIVKDFEYHLSSLDLYKGNPLIEALPNFLEYSILDISRALRKKPPEYNFDANRRQRDQWLGTLVDQCFIPLPRHIQLLEAIDILIRQGYVNRNPRRDIEERERLINAYERVKSGEKFLQIYDSNQQITPLSISVIGCSGIGKTYAVSRILSLYPQALSHKDGMIGTECTQIVYLRVECPYDGSIKSLCINTIAAIDNVVGENFSSWARRRRTIEELKSRLSQLIALYHIGILVIDEIQNIMANRQNKNLLFNFLVSLSNTLCVPLMFIGTPKISKFINLDFKTSRRFGSFGTFEWEYLKNSETDHEEWDLFIKELSQYNILFDETQTMPKEVSDILYYHSQGIIDILLKLFILSQKKALVLKHSYLTPELISSVFDESFSRISSAIKALRENNIIELNNYEDIILPRDVFYNASNTMSSEIKKEEENVDDFKEVDISLKERVKSALRSLGVDIYSDVDQELDNIIKNNTDISSVALMEKFLNKNKLLKKLNSDTDQKTKTLLVKPDLPINDSGEL